MGRMPTSTTIEATHAAALACVEMVNRKVAPVLAMVERVQEATAATSAIAEKAAAVLASPASEAEAVFQRIARGAQGRTSRLTTWVQRRLRGLRGMASAWFRALDSGAFYAWVRDSLAPKPKRYPAEALNFSDLNAPNWPSAAAHQPAAVPTCLQATVLTLVAAPGAPSGRAAAA